MSKNTFYYFALTLSTLVLFSGCAERGYHLTRQSNTHTITAQSSVDLGNTQINTQHELHKMQAAVKKERKKTKAPKADNTITEINARKERLKALKAQQNTAFKEEQRQAQIARKKEKIREAENIRREQEARKKARQEKMIEEAQIKKAQEVKRKKLQMLKANNEAKKAKALEAQIAQEKQIQEAKKAKALEAEKIQKAKALEAKQKLAAQQALARKKAEEERKRKAEEQAVIEKEEKAKIKRLQEQREREIQRNKVKKEKKSAAATEPLKFQLLNKIYHKFGTSEIHGHVIYLNGSGQEVRLSGAKVYLLPVSAKLNHWFENYYLQNKSNPNDNGMVANYLNSTYLNLEKNFEFYGVAEGSYYVIIEAKYPSSMARDKKIYIAKKVQVGKYKKIMAVFSKKL